MLGVSEGTNDRSRPMLPERSPQKEGLAKKGHRLLFDIVFGGLDN